MTTRTTGSRFTGSLYWMKTLKQVLDVLQGLKEDVGSPENDTEQNANINEDRET